ncbi:MAG: hypothetical protein FJ009_03665 [Chloroflexi bacterium]|nr:hypothetical protein [Chloroflexota bacterium]
MWSSIDYATTRQFYVNYKCVLTSGLALSFLYYVIPAAFALGALAIAIFVFALYRLFHAESPALSLVGAVVGIGGGVILAALVLLVGSQNNAIQNLAIWASFFAPSLFFGWLAYQHSKVGMARPLALSGLVGGLGGLVNIIVTLIGGGSWEKPNNPALSPVIMGSYYIGMLLTMVWMVWSSIVLLRRKA